MPAKKKFRCVYLKAGVKLNKATDEIRYTPDHPDWVKVRGLHGYVTTEFDERHKLIRRRVAIKPRAKK